MRKPTFWLRLLPPGSRPTKRNGLEIAKLLDASSSTSISACLGRGDATVGGKAGE